MGNKINQIIIMAAMKEEADILVKSIEPESLWQRDESSWEGVINGQDVVISVCGIGKVNVAVQLTFLIQELGEDILVLNTGVAGGFPGSSTLEMVIPYHVSYHDFDLTALGYLKNQVPGFQPKFAAHVPTVSDLKRCIGSSYDGDIISGDQFIHTSDKVVELCNNFPNAQAADMESAAVGQVCEKLDVPFAVVRCISDELGTEMSPAQYQKFMPDAAKKSADLILRFLQKRTNSHG